jgi:hypothetical protein
VIRFGALPSTHPPREPFDPVRRLVTAPATRPSALA